jgi:hypothetical protein
MRDNLTKAEVIARCRDGYEQNCDMCPDLECEDNLSSFSVTRLTPIAEYLYEKYKDGFFSWNKLDAEETKDWLDKARHIVELYLGRANR